VERAIPRIVKEIAQRERFVFGGKSSEQILDRRLQISVFKSEI
jgi:hypothetical protein